MGLNTNSHYNDLLYLLDPLTSWTAPGEYVKSDELSASPSMALLVDSPIPSRWFDRSDLLLGFFEMWQIDRENVKEGFICNAMS